MSKLLACTLLVALARPEEQSIMGGCSLIDRSISSQNTFTGNAICDGGFKSQVNHLAVNSQENAELVGSLAKAQRIKSAFVQNQGPDLVDKQNMEESALYLGTDNGAFSADMKKCSADFYDSGFHEVTCDSEVTHFAIRKYAAEKNRYRVNEIRLYQTPNLITEFVNIYSNSGPLAGSNVSFLQKDLSARSPNSQTNALNSKTASTISSSSCYKTDSTKIGSSNQWTLRVDLK